MMSFCREVHTYDLIRADDTNPDYKPSDSNLIHWGKFSLMAKMILNVVTYQDRFDESDALVFAENKEVNELLMNVIVMDEDVSPERFMWCCRLERLTMDGYRPSLNDHRRLSTLASLEALWMPPVLLVSSHSSSDDNSPNTPIYPRYTFFFFLYIYTM